YGNDIDDTTSPIEAGLGWITKFTKDFINADYHKAIKDNGPKKKLVGFEIPEKGKIPRQHFKIKDADGNEIGEVTSGTQSPTLGKAIGLGYVKTEFSAVGSAIFVEIRNQAVKAIVVKTPFL
ncbi:MAG TPA: glycine cleavage T C-terminal barrel domain-containing protein, partial [Chitinophagales bacterium]|nr:glycine cleavage T C-terminal barrel domain-containing protein [Chitinophagales bacterium]